MIMLALFAIGFSGCDGRERANGSHSDEKISDKSITTEGDKVYEEIVAFQRETRTWYNSKNFNELEKRANDLRASKARFGNGSWKLFQFYEALGCRREEPESMWQLHDQIHGAWMKLMPMSITSRVAYADFLTDYAWHARGYGFRDTVTTEGWRLFAEGMAASQKILDESKTLEPKCPMWWLVYMRVGLGQNWERADHDKVFAQAKEFEPQFWSYDLARANYLLPKWNGEPGEWEQATEEETKRPAGLGMEIYARVVSVERSSYKNIFRETNASWPKTREGFELMRQRYPDSLEIISAYCRLACVAEDRPQAKKLFDELKGHVTLYVWESKENFLKNRAWAEGK